MDKTGYIFCDQVKRDDQQDRTIIILTNNFSWTAVNNHGETDIFYVGIILNII